jgi:hypothetical protein
MNTKRLLILIFAFLSTAFVSAPQSNSLEFTGVGDDVITAEFSVADYPVMEISAICEYEYDYVTVTLFGSNDEEISAFYDSCEKTGQIYYANNEIDQVEYLQISGAIDWTLTFLPINDANIETYTAPAKIEGSGTAFFIVNNPGKVLQFDYSGDDYVQVYQYSGEGVKGWDGYKQLFYEQGPYSGKTIINPKFTIFQIFSSDAWSFDISGSGGSKTEQTPVAAPTSVSLFPTKAPTEAPVETIAENKSPDFLTLYGDRASFPDYDNQMQLAASSFGLLGGKYVNNWELFTYTGDFTLEELANQLYDFYAEEYADDGYTKFAEPRLFPLVLMGEDLGEGYQMLLQRDTDRIWIVVSESAEQEKGVFVFYCNTSAAG